jgi:hypothetical protein
LEEQCTFKGGFGDGIGFSSPGANPWVLRLSIRPRAISILANNSKNIVGNLVWEISLTNAFMGYKFLFANTAIPIREKKSDLPILAKHTFPSEKPMPP